MLRRLLGWLTGAGAKPPAPAEEPLAPNQVRSPLRDAREAPEEVLAALRALLAGGPAPAGVRVARIRSHFTGDDGLLFDGDRGVVCQWEGPPHGLGPWTVRAEWPAHSDAVRALAEALVGDPVPAVAPPAAPGVAPAVARATSVEPGSPVPAAPPEPRDTPSRSHLVLVGDAWLSLARLPAARRAAVAAWERYLEPDQRGRRRVAQ